MSTVTVPSWELHEWCSQVLTAISRARTRKWNQAVDARIEQSRRSIFRRIFFRPVLTRPQAESCLMDDCPVGIFTTWDYVQIFGGQAEDKANELLAASSVSDRVHVAAQDTEILSKWIPFNSLSRGERRW